MQPVIFFDLDDTLIYEDATDDAVIAEVGREYLPDRSIPERRLIVAVREAARDLWYRSDAAEYCRRIQTSSIEGMYGDYAGDDPGLRAIRAFLAGGYRERVWAQALRALLGEDSPARAPLLAQAFAVRRASRNVLIPDAVATLDELAVSYRLALITNGASQVQRAKLAGSGLARYFDPIIVSSEFGVSKPDPSIYRHGLTLVGAEPGAAVMVGNSLSRDVVGAQAIGIRGIWLNSNGDEPGNEHPWRTATQLREIPAIVREALPG